MPHDVGYGDVIDDGTCITQRFTQRQLLKQNFPLRNIFVKQQSLPVG